MSAADGLVMQLKNVRKYFKTTLSALDESDSGFAPTPDQFTVAAQVAHTADTAAWFIEGGFGEGWDLDFESSNDRARAVTSLSDAVEQLDRAFDRAEEVVGTQSDEELMAPIEDARMMGGAPRMAVVAGIVDHTAHHRGSLAVYARVLGKVPPMPYA